MTTTEPMLPHTFEWEADGPTEDGITFTVRCSECHATRVNLTADEANEWGSAHECEDTTAQQVEEAAQAEALRIVQGIDPARLAEVADEREIAAVLVGRQVVDEETGEILEWPVNCTTGPERIAYLTHLHREADRGIKAWEIDKAKYARLLGRALAEAGMKSLRSDYGNAISVAATTVREAPASNVARAAEAELLTSEQAALLLTRAADKLDVDEVEKWIGEQGEDVRKVLRLALITNVPRRGYTYSREPSKPSPRRDAPKEATA